MQRAAPLAAPGLPDAGRLVALQEPDEPPLNTLLLVQRPGAEAHPGVLRVRDRVRDTARGG